MNFIDPMRHFILYSLTLQESFKNILFWGSEIFGREIEKEHILCEGIE